MQKNSMIMQRRAANLICQQSTQWYIEVAYAKLHYSSEEAGFRFIIPTYAKSGGAAMLLDVFLQICFMQNHQVSSNIEKQCYREEDKEIQSSKILT